MKKNKLSIIIIAGNEEKMIKPALESAEFADEIIVVLANSIDNTEKICRQYTKKIIKTKDEYGKYFAKWRNLGLKKAKSDWLFYLDADERIPIELKKELLRVTSYQLPVANYYAVPRANYYLGKRVKYGGSYPDYVKRLFLRAKLKKWQGGLHEEPIIKGEIGHLKNDLVHYTHRDLTSMLEKTINWSETEAQLLYEAGHPSMVAWRFMSVMFREFWNRGIKKQGFRDGTVGFIEVIYQVFSRFITYARLWEKQQKKH